MYNSNRLVFLPASRRSTAHVTNWWLDVARYVIHRIARANSLERRPRPSHWSASVRLTTSGCILGSFSIANASYTETYNVEFQGGSWIVTQDDLKEV